LRVSVGELAALAAAAARVGETPSGYAARVALAVARGDQVLGVDVAELRELAYDLLDTRAVLARTADELDQAARAAGAESAEGTGELAAAAERCEAAITVVEQAGRAATRLLAGGSR
jgi:hypothetical protein